MLCLANQTPPFHPEDAFRPTASRPLTYQTLSGRFQPCRQGSVTGCSEQRAVGHTRRLCTRGRPSAVLRHCQLWDVDPGPASFLKMVRSLDHGAQLFHLLSLDVPPRSAIPMPQPKALACEPGANICMH